jgi:glycosyltransferase involved in cell wall biosynthesis
MRILADIRCLQDPGYVFRGVGSHSASLLKAIRVESEETAEIIGLIDPAMGPLHPEHCALCDAVQPAFVSADDMTPAVFLSLSPMTHDTLQASRLLGRRHILPAAVLYDFIPAEYPERYLRDTASLLHYAAAIKWLEEYRVFFPISHHVGAEAIRRLGLGSRQTVVTGVSLRPRFEEMLKQEEAASSGAPGEGRYILFVGGGDQRKNLDTVVEAFQRLGDHERLTARLVIAGGYPEAWQARVLAEADGTVPAGEIRFLPHLDDEALAGWYRGAVVTVVASVAEGFSMPVIEALACGSPVLASDIPVHRELVESPESRFDPHDASELTDKLASALRGNNTTTMDLSETPRRFTRSAVGTRFWQGLAGAFENFLASRPRVNVQRRKRIAFVTPFPPDRSGVADYSASTVAALGRIADVDVYTDQPEPTATAGVREFHPITAAAWLRPDYDSVVSVIGNSHFHTKIIDLHRRFGGPCIVHDNRLAEVTAFTKGVDYLREQAQRFLSRPVSEGEVHEWLANPGQLPSPFYDDVLLTACPMIVHSRGIQATVRSLYGVEVEYLPFSIYRQFEADARRPEVRAAARRRLRIPADRTVVVSLGIVDRVKSPETCVEAMGVLKRKGRDCHLYFVGVTTAEMRTTLEQRASQCGVAGRLHFMDHWLSDLEYRDYVLAADMGIQLRNHFFGGLSGALLDCVAAGLPTVTNKDLAEAVETPQYVVRVPDRPDAETLADGMHRILHQRTDSKDIVRSAAQFASEHSFETYARRLLDVARPRVSGRLVG